MTGKNMKPLKTDIPIQNVFKNHYTILSRRDKIKKQYLNFGKNM